MLIKWIHFATILAHIILINASKHSEDVDFDDTSESDDDESENPCIDGQCTVGSKEEQNELSFIKPIEETKDRKEDEQPNVLDLVKLLTLFAKKSDKEPTKISFNIRDIQNGFHNTGQNYHVGNIHRELNRNKRDTVPQLNQGTETGIALTTETSSYNTQTAVEEIGSKELDIKSVTEIPQANSDDKAVNTIVKNTEADSFQDSGVTDVDDSIANDTTTESVNENGEISNGNVEMVNDGQDARIWMRNDDSNSSDSETVLQGNSYLSAFLDNSETTLIRTSNQADSGNVTVATEGTVSGENDLGSHKNQSQLSNVKIPLSRKDLNKIQNILSDDLGVKSKGAIPVANFSLNEPLDSSKKNPVIVIVYNCSCGSKDNNHTHDNSTEHDVVGNVDTNNDKVIFNTRRMLSNDELIISSALTEDKPEETLFKKAEKEQNKTTNTLLENELLQKCQSLLSFQRKSKVNEASETQSENVNEEILSSYQANTEVSNQQPTSEFIDDGSAKQTPVDDVDINVAKASQADWNTDVEDQAVSLVNENVNNVVNETSTLPTIDSIVEEPVTTSRKRRSITNEMNSLTKRNTVPQISIVDRIFKYLMIVPNNSKEVSNLPNNESVLVKTGNGKHRELAEYSKDVANKTKRDTKLITLNPKYYDYSNDKPNLLESNPNHDKSIINFKPIDDDTAILESLNTEFKVNNKKYDNSVDFVNEDKLPSHKGDISSDDRDLLNLLSFKPFYINVYLQILMKNFEKDLQNYTS